MDFKKTAREIVHSLRGTLYQKELNKKLGYNFNKISRLERGLTETSWEDFILICRVRNIDIRKILKNLFYFNKPPTRSDLFLKHLAGKHKQKEIAKQLSVSVYVVNRWLKGSSTPTLSSVLKVIHTFTPSITEFCNFVVDIKTLPSVYPIHERKMRAKSLLLRFPYVVEILCALNLQEYKKLSKHKNGFIANKIGISLDEEVAVLRELYTLGIVNFKNEKFISGKHSLDIRGDFKSKNAARLYWLQRTIKMLSQLKQNSDPSSFGYLSFDISNEAAEKIKQAYYAFYHELTGILESDQFPSKRIQLLMVQLIDFDEMVLDHKN